MYVMTGPKRSELDALREESELLDRIHHRAVAHSLIFTSDDEDDDEEEEDISMSSAVSSLHEDTFNTRKTLDRVSLPLPTIGGSQKDDKLISLHSLQKPISIGDGQPPPFHEANYNNSDKTKDDPRLKEMRQTMIEYGEEVDNLNKENLSLKETVNGLERVIANSDKRNTELQRLLNEAYKREREKDIEIKTLKDNLQQAEVNLSNHQTETSSLRSQVEELSPVVDIAHNSEVKEERLISLLCRHRVLLLRIQHRLAAQTRDFTTFLDKITEITKAICGANLGISVGLDDIQTEVSSMRKEMLEARVTLQQSHNEKLQSDEESIMSLSQRYAEEAASWQAERRQHLEAAVTWLAQKKAYEKKKASWKEERKKLTKEIADLKDEGKSRSGVIRAYTGSVYHKRLHALTLHQCIREILEVQRGQLIMKMMLKKKNDMHTVNARYDSTVRKLLWCVPGDIGSRTRGIRLEDVVRIDFGILARAYMLHRPIGYSTRRQSSSLPSYKCFTLWTAQRSYDFYSSNINIVCCFVIALSRLCTNAKAVALTRSQFYIEVIKAKMDEYCRAHRTTRVKMILDGIKKVNRKAQFIEVTSPS